VEQVLKSELKEEPAAGQMPDCSALVSQLLPGVVQLEPVQPDQQWSQPQRVFQVLPSSIIHAQPAEFLLTVQH
jgi:hypothetical protein